MELEMLFAIFELFERLDGVNLLKVFIRQDAHAFGNVLFGILENLERGVKV